MEPFEGDPSTRGRLTSLRNKSQQEQPRQLSASIHASIVSQCIQLSFDGEKCVLLLCTWKASFLKSGHILRSASHILLSSLTVWGGYSYSYLSTTLAIYFSLNIHNTPTVASYNFNISSCNCSESVLLLNRDLHWMQ